MFDAIRARLRFALGEGRRRDRVSIILPFVIISIGIGALAWRSYTLSEKMERGANTLALQYAGYAADITARRVDAAVRAEMARAAEEWQATERRIGDPTFTALREWFSKYRWIVQAMYVSDFDPASSIYVAEPAGKSASQQRLTRDFFTATGVVRYSYDPERLLEAVQPTVRQQPLIRTTDAPGTLPVQQQAYVSVVRSGSATGWQKEIDGFAFVTPLSAPLEGYAVRAMVRTAYVGGRAWHNPRVMSLWLSFLALLLMAVGTALALRGINKEAETTKLRGALIANVSHELRTPLSMIRLGAETLKRGRLKDKERTDIEDQILREVLLLSHLVENVLDVARIQNRNEKAMAFTSVQPRDLIRALVTTYESWIHSKGFTVTVETDDAINQQMWDRDAVSRALLNLIDNAIKYSGDDRRLEIVLRQSADDVMIEVRDHGVGIDAKDLARIFDPYYRAKFSDTITRRGAGLGLTLVQQIVEAHGGRVEVDSVPGIGSTFRLLFPRALESPSTVHAFPSAREAF